MGYVENIHVSYFATLVWEISFNYFVIEQYFDVTTWFCLVFTVKYIFKSSI